MGNSTFTCSTGGRRSWAGAWMRITRLIRPRWMGLGLSCCKFCKQVKIRKGKKKKRTKIYINTTQESGLLHSQIFHTIFKRIPVLLMYMCDIYLSYFSPKCVYVRKGGGILFYMLCIIHGESVLQKTARRTHAPSSPCSFFLLFVHQLDQTHRLVGPLQPGPPRSRGLDSIVQP
jgi:hypothetical protein